MKKILEEKYGITDEVIKSWAKHVRTQFRHYYDETLTLGEVLASEAFKEVVEERGLEGIEYTTEWKNATCSWRIEWTSIAEPPRNIPEAHEFARLIKSGKVEWVGGVCGR